MEEHTGYMKCPKCGVVWKGRWDTGQDVTCPECGSPLEEIPDEELQDR